MAKKRGRPKGTGAKKAATTAIPDKPRNDDSYSVILKKMFPSNKARLAAERERKEAQRALMERTEDFFVAVGDSKNPHIQQGKKVTCGRRRKLPPVPKSPPRYNPDGTQVRGVKPGMMYTPRELEAFKIEKEKKAAAKAAAALARLEKAQNNVAKVAAHVPRHFEEALRTAPESVATAVSVTAAITNVRAQQQQTLSSPSVQVMQQAQQPQPRPSLILPPPIVKIPQDELKERTVEAAAKSKEQAQAALKSAVFGSATKTMLPDNWLGLRSFYDLMFMDRGYKVPSHLELPIYALTDKRISRLMINISPGAGKSVLFSTIFPAYTLGQDPRMTILGISAGENLMQGFQLAIMGWVEHHPMWKQLFPNVQPNKDKGWSTERGMFVTGHRDGDPDASFFATGLGSKALTGKHAKIIICDDIHDNENSVSAESCLKVREKYYNTIRGRADPEGARFICAGRRWHEEDLYGHLKSTGEWVVMELPALREGSQELYWDVTVPAGMQCCFTDGTIGEKLT